MNKYPSESPWPEDVWPTTLEEAGNHLRKAIGDKNTTAISGSLMRHGYRIAERDIKEHLLELWLARTETYRKKQARAKRRKDLGDCAQHGGKITELGRCMRDLDRLANE